MKEQLELRPEVAAFAQLMEKELRENDHKGGWKNCKPEQLLRRVQEELKEFEDEFMVRTGPHVWIAYSPNHVKPDRVASEGADVANMVMMIVDIYGGLK